MDSSKKADIVEEQEEIPNVAEEKGNDGTVNQPVVEKCLDEKDIGNISADSSLKTIFEEHRKQQSQGNAENCEKIESKEIQDLKQDKELDKCRTDSLDDDDAKSYNAGMLDERKKDEISHSGELEEGEEAKQQEVVEEKNAVMQASDKAEQGSENLQSQSVNKLHYLNQNNYSNDAPKSEVAFDKFEQNENDGKISVITDNSGEGAQQVKSEDKEPAEEYKESHLNTWNGDMSECKSYEKESNVSEVEDKQSEIDKQSKVNDSESEVDKQSKVVDNQSEVDNKQSKVIDKQSEVDNEQSKVMDIQSEVDNEQNKDMDTQSEVENEQSKVMDNQSEVDNEQNKVMDNQSEVDNKQSKVMDNQSEVDNKQSNVDDNQIEVNDNQFEVDDKESKVDGKTNNDESETMPQSAVPRNNEFQEFSTTSDEKQEESNRDISEEKGSILRLDSNKSNDSNENIGLTLVKPDSQSMPVDTTTCQINLETVVDTSIKSPRASSLKPDDTKLNIPMEDQSKSNINSSSPPETMDTSEISMTRQNETIALPEEESSNITKPLFDKIKILKAEENSNTSTGDEHSVESSALDNSCLNTPQEENSCLSFPDESSILSFMDESSGISVPDSEPNFLQYQRRQNLSLFDEAANLSAPDDKCFQRPDTPSSAVTETQDSTPAKKPRRSSISSVTQDVTGDDHGPFKAENLYEYHWPQEPDAEWYLLQEHVSEFLEVKSFKRKYPDLFRRVCDKHEKDFLREKGVVTETQSDLGLTALKSDEVHDFMARDYPEKYREYMKVLHEREKQNISNKHRDYEVPKLEKGKIKEYTKKAVKAAAEWNRQFQRERKEERRAYFDVQTFTVHYPVSRYKKLSVEATKVDPYPVALIPGQFQEYYRRYSKEELKYFPLNTSLFDPPKRMHNNLANPGDADSEDQEEEGKQADSGSGSESGDDSSSNSDGSSNSEDIPMEVDTPRPGSALSPKLEAEDAQCRICKTKAEKKKKIKKKDEELVQCSECKSLGHPSCLDLTNKMIAVIKTYPWQCMECKTCVECMDPYDEDKMMFCDRCDRGYHTFCVGLKSLPTGKWECVSCKSAPSTPKSITKSKRGRKKENGK